MARRLCGVHEIPIPLRQMGQGNSTASAAGGLPAPVPWSAFTEGNHRRDTRHRQLAVMEI